VIEVDAMIQLRKLDQPHPHLVSPRRRGHLHLMGGRVALQQPHLAGAGHLPIVDLPDQQRPIGGQQPRREALPGRAARGGRPLRQHRAERCLERSTVDYLQRAIERIEPQHAEQRLQEAQPVHDLHRDAAGRCQGQQPGDRALPHHRMPGHGVDDRAVRLPRLTQQSFGQGLVQFVEGGCLLVHAVETGDQLLSPQLGPDRGDCRMHEGAKENPLGATQPLPGHRRQQPEIARPKPDHRDRCRLPRSR